MRRLAIVYAAAGLAVTLTGAPQADAQTLYTCGQGTVRDVQSIIEFVARPMVTTQPSRVDEPPGVERPSRQKHRRYLVTVQLDDLVYTGRSSADASWNFDPTRLAINDSIAICANGTQMVLDRLDGTDYRATIVRIDRSPDRRPDPSSDGPPAQVRHSRTPRTTKSASAAATVPAARP